MRFSNILLTLASAASAVTAMGINCAGSALCTGSRGTLGSALGQLRALDQNQQFTDGQHITCVGSISLGNPELCIFYQKTGRSWTVAQTVWFVQALLDHGCGACGSIPVDSGNNVQNGMLTANMVASILHKSRRGMDMVARTAPHEEAKKPAVEPAVLQAVEQALKQVDEETAAIAKRDTSPNTPTKLAKRLGINCQGSSTCQVGGIFHLPAGTLSDLRNSIAGGPDGFWSNGQQVGCIAHVTGRLCAFYQNIGSRTFNKEQTITYMQWLLDHGCRVCGSVPTDDGNNVANGQLTVNYVA